MDHSTNVAKLLVDAEGKPIVQSWSEWWPSPHLRWTKNGLQQLHYRNGYDSTGAASSEQEEWRLVPTQKD